MLSSFIIAFAAVGILAMIFFTPCKMYEGIMRMQYGGVPDEEKVKKWIPIYNVIKTESLYFGGGKHLIPAAYICFTLACVMKAVLWSTQSVTVAVATAVFVFVGVILLYLANAALVAKVLVDSGCMSVPFTIFLTLLYPVGQNYIGLFLPAKVEATIKKESIF